MSVSSSTRPFVPARPSALARPPAPACPPAPTRRPVRRRRAVIAALVGAGALVVLPAVGASAHVHVIPEETAEGSYAALTFRVPTEEDSRTTGLVVTLPTATPFTYVATRPLAGWTGTVTEGTLPKPVVVGGATITKAPLTVTWTAAPGAGPGPHQFEEFELVAGPLPASGTRLLLPAVQTYASGVKVSWTQITPVGATEAQEPEHPAPEFTVTAAEDEGHAAEAVKTSAMSAASTASETDDGDRGLWFGVAGLVVGAVALGVGGFAARRSR